MSKYAGKSILMVARVGDPFSDPVGSATTKCRECGADCSIAPASIERLRIEPEIVVLCVECGVAVHKERPFDRVEAVSIVELAEAIMRRAKR